MYETIKQKTDRLEAFRAKMRQESGLRNPRCRCGHYLDIHDRYTSGGDEEKKIAPMCYADKCDKHCMGFRLDQTQDNPGLADLAGTR